MMGHMKLYADAPARRSFQALTDVAVLVWVALCCFAGRALRDAVLGLQQPAHQLEHAGRTFASTMHEAGTAMAGLPVVGQQLQPPFTQAAGSGTSLAQAGRDLSAGIGHVALVVGLLSAVLPIVVVVLPWLWVRLRFARRATSAQRFLDGTADLELFALRAMAHQPMARIARVSDDPVGDWRRADPGVVRALARLELRDSGLRL